MNKLEFNIFEERDCYDGLIQFQELLQIRGNGGTSTLYSVSNLSDCPEDAIIERDLTSAERIIDFIKYGMRLNALGYDADDIVIYYTIEEKNI